MTMYVKTWTLFRRAVCAAGIAVLLQPDLSAAQEKGEFQKAKGGFVERIERHVNTGPGGFVELSTARGEIHVDTWKRSEVRIEVEKEVDVSTADEAREIFAGFAVHISRENNEVYVSAEQEDETKSKSLRVRFVLTVPQQYRLKLKTSGGAIEVKRLDGAVEAETGGGNIKVGRVNNGLVDVETGGGNIVLQAINNGDVRAQTSGGNIKVGMASGDLELHTSGGTIKVDRVGGDIEAETVAGSIKINEAGGRVRAETRGGSIHIGPVRGAVEAETSGGSIHIGPGQGYIKAETSGGSIEIKGSGGLVEAEASGGSIEIRGARGAIEAETAGGDIEAELVLDSWEADTHCKLETSGGDIVFYMPAHLPATLDAELKVKRKAGGDYGIYSDFPLVVEGEGSKRITGWGEVNGGGDLIELGATDGDIRIRKIMLDEE